jgi:acyl carrier protein
MAAMERDEVMTLVREHLSTELEVSPERIQAETRFREDLDADSLDLYELVMELEDRYGIRVCAVEGAVTPTVGDAVVFVGARVPADKARVLRGDSRGATR